MCTQEVCASTEEKVNRKGQAAMEFIMTYGWAIIAILAAVSALAYFGVLNPSKYVPDKCIFKTGLSCTDYVLQDNGGNLQLRFTIQNNLGEGIQLRDGDNVTAEYKDAGYITCTADNGFALTISAGDSEGFTCLFGAGTSPGAGQQARVKIRVNYVPTAGQYAKKADGEVSMQVQE